MPTCPGVPQIVPAEILDPRRSQSLVPSLGTHLDNGPAIEAKHMRLMLPNPLADQQHGFRIERHRNRLSRLA